MQGLPTGTVTFLFTDLAGSTRLWEDFPDAMQPALARHDEILRDAITAHDGHVVKTTGDGFHAAFATAPAAAAAAVAAQRALAAETWPGTGPLRVRMGLHTGTGELRDGDYYGTSLNRAARIMAIAHGGQVVCSHATEVLLHDQLTDGMGLVDLGEHGLRDLARPERVFQLTAPGLDEVFPPLRSLDALPGNLPIQPTSFVGRDEELAELADRLVTTRLLTITGVGGVGKTRLALQVAAEIVPRFADGAWLCELAPASDDDALAEVVAAALGVPPVPGLGLERSIVEFLRTKHLLLVLDNCEHLLDGAARLAEAVLRECPQVHLLATSREGLAVRGEEMTALRSLALPERDTDVVALAAVDAVRLFTERARAARAGFVLDAANAEAVAEICRRLDGIPLALELAAARVATMNPTDVARRIDERFRLLGGTRRGGVERHQTLRATVDWSYSLLDPVEQLVFDRLGVFVGSFDADAAQDVVHGDGVDDWDVVDTLGSLVLKSMVVIDDDPDGAARYHLLETMRAYGREQLDHRDETDDWRRRHATHYADVAELTGAALRGPDELRWRRRLRTDLDNLRAAVGWALDRDDPADRRLGIRIVAALAYEVTMDRRSGYGEWAERALAVIDSATPAERSGILGAAAHAAMHRGDTALCCERAEAAIADEGFPDSLTPNLPYVARALAQMTDGDALGAAAWAARRLDHPGMDNRAFDVANTLSVQAIMLALNGDLVAATPIAERCVEMSRGIGNPSHLAIALATYGLTIHVVDPRRALDAMEESVAITSAGGSDVLLAECLGRIAEIRTRLGAGPAALDATARAIRHSLDSADQPGLLGALDIAAEALAAVGELALAARCAAIPPAQREFLSGVALEFHQASLAPVRDGLGSNGIAAAAEWARAGTPEGRAREILAELDALIAVAAAAGADEGEHPSPSP